jgi:hypothetical protein
MNRWFINSQLVGSINISTLKEKVALIAPASQGEISVEAGGNDMGSSGCVAYVFEKSNSSYSTVDLGSRGDWNSRNSSPEAQALYLWLLGLWEKYRS